MRLYSHHKFAMQNIQTPKDSLNPEAINSWFTELIDDIKTDHFLFSQDVTTPEKRKFYTDLISGNTEATLSTIRTASSMYFISNIIKDYLQELKTAQKRPLKLAMGLSDSKLLVWAVVKDNDEKTEDTLLIAEAKVNGKYQEKGFYLSSTIVEESDNIPTPPHYQPIIG